MLFPLQQVERAAMHTAKASGVRKKVIRFIVFSFCGGEMLIAIRRASWIVFWRI